MRKTNLVIGVLLTWVTLGAGCAEPGPEELLGLAVEAIAAGDGRTAEIHLKNLLREQPDNAVARSLLGQVALANGDPFAAESALKRALELGANPAEVQLPLVRALIAQGRAADALAQIEAGPELTGDNRVTELRLEGSAYRALNQNAEAEASYRAAIAVDPRSVEARTDLAILLLAVNRTEEGRRLVRDVLADAPTHSRALLARGLLEFASGRLEEAEATMREVAEREGPTGESYFAAMSQLVEVLIARDDLEAASAAAQTLLESFPNEPIAIVLMANIEIKQHKLDLARPRLDALLSRAPNYSVANRLLGILSARQGQFQQAEMYLRRAITQSPNDVSAIVHLAHLRLSENDVAAARMILAAASMQTTDNDAVLFAAAARAALRIREESIANRFLNEAERIGSDAPEAQLALVSVYLEAGQPERATELLQASAASGTDTAWVGLFGLALTQVNARDYAAADASLGQLIEAQPGLAWPLNLRGMVAAVARNFGAAEEHFTAALQADPNYLPALLNRARLASLAGRRDAAAADYRAVLDRDAANANALLALAEIAVSQRDFAEAQRLAERAPESVPRLRLEAAIAAGQGDFGAAAAKLERVFAEQPSAENAVQAFRARQRAGTEDPQAPLQAWLAENPRDVPVNLALGAYWLGTSDFAAAIPPFEAVAEVEPERADVLNNLAWLYSQRNDDRALAFAERAYAAAPDNPAIADTLGWLYVSNGDVRKGLPLLEAGHAGLPDNAEIHYHLAAALAEVGENERAAQTLRNLLAEHDSFADRAAAEALLLRLE